MFVSVHTLVSYFTSVNFLFFFLVAETKVLVRRWCEEHAAQCSG